MCTYNNENWSDCSENEHSGEDCRENTWEETTNNEDDCCSNSTGNSSEGNSVESDGWCDESECNDVTQKLVMNPSVYVVKAGVTTPFTVSTYPCRQDVTNSATWSSSNNSVASVNQQGYITTRRDGTATITATYNGMTATCNLTVDSRPLVRVVKMSEGDHFFVNFVNQKEGEAYRWKSVGCDLNLQENRSGYDIWNDDEDLLLPSEKHRKFNSEQKYTSEQLALLYRLDPYGVVDYVKDRIYKENMDITEELNYKDEVYRAIFVVKPNKFYFRPDDYGTPVFGSYADCERKKVYSLAEMVFGKHTIVEFDLWDFIVNGIKSVFSILPGLDTICSAVELCELLFFSASITGAVSSAATGYLEESMKLQPENGIYTETALREARKKKAETTTKLFKAANLILGVVGAALDAIEVLDVETIDVCKSVKQYNNYRVVLQNNNAQLSLEEIIELCG